MCDAFEEADASGGTLDAGVPNGDPAYYSDMLWAAWASSGVLLYCTTILYYYTVLLYCTTILYYYTVLLYCTTVPSCSPEVHRTY
jgi:hypothetical protein